jgi:hypothetical protein
MKGTAHRIAAAFQILASKKEDISILVKADIFILGRQHCIDRMYLKPCRDSSSLEIG